MTEIVRKETYIFNGVEYPTWNDANKAEIQYKISNVSNRYEQLKKNNLARHSLHNLMKRYQKPFLMVYYEKHGDRYFHITSKEDVLNSIKQILVERINPSFPWYFDDDMELAKMIVANDDKEMMYAFLSERKSGEYELFSFTSYEN